MDISGKEVAVIVQALKVAHFDELAEKVITHFNDLNERFGTVFWTEEDIRVAFENNGITATAEQISDALDYVNEDKMCDSMIQEGWTYINEAVDKYLADNSEE